MQDPWEIDENSFPKNGSLESQIKFILGYAILAPSTHNSQPWLFKISGEECKIYNNKDIVIYEADPKKRDLFISFGTFIENLVIASRYFGMFNSVSYDEDLNNTLIATVRFTKPSSYDNSQALLLDAIPKRLNARGFFDDKQISNSFLEKIKTKLSAPNNIQIDFITNKEKIDDIANLTAKGIKVAYNNKRFRKEMAHWINSNYSKRSEGLHGYSLRMPSLLSLLFPSIVSHINVGSFLAKKNYDSISSAPLICIFSAKNENFKTWLEIGRIAQRLSLLFTAEKIYTSIFVASIEMGFAPSVQRVLENDLKWKPQFMYCAGYMDNVQPHSKRHIVEEKLL